MSKKTASLYARVEPEVKEKAEEILSELGIPVSSAINMFYKQIILQKGLPFDVRIPRERPIYMDEETLRKEFEKGYQDMVDDRLVSYEEVLEELKKKYGI